MSVTVSVSEHAREKFLKRAERIDLTPRIEDAWQQGYDISDGPWLRGERARYDPTTRVVMPVRDGVIRTAIYAPSAKPAVQAAVRNAGWSP
ncbi:hypothetical protein J2754_000730 [Halarchaeum solikamskense]|uniref:hypothetical protein n=1 Tax=Halarchaeum nitratireducens TaxID=489913 RepID=UPI001B3AA97F|nr:hypothetical protein [Halarchaeum solikamskense]MBP2250433.1 hypothetical protein [Halarchaeum solikamskense]